MYVFQCESIEIFLSFSISFRLVKKAHPEIVAHEIKKPFLQGFMREILLLFLSFVPLLSFNWDWDFALFFVFVFVWKIYWTARNSLSKDRFYFVGLKTVLNIFFYFFSFWKISGSCRTKQNFTFSCLFFILVKRTSRET